MEQYRGAHRERSRRGHVVLGALAVVAAGIGTGRIIEAASSHAAASPLAAHSTAHHHDRKPHHRSQRRPHVAAWHFAAPPIIPGAYRDRPERDTRQRIVQIADQELAKHVHEVPDGSNLGPRINFYLAQKLNHWSQAKYREWCAGFVSTDLMLANTPLSGGAQYHPHNPDYLVLRAGKAAHPHEKFPVTSVLQWFQEDGYIYRNNGHQPKAGDVVFMMSQSSAGKQFWHVGLVQEVSGDTLITDEGNVGNALIQKEYPDYQANSYIYGFGSFWPEK